MTKPILPANLLFPFLHPHARASAEGRFVDGGRTAYRDDDSGLAVEIELSPTVFAAWVLLMRRAVHAAELGLPPAEAFVSRQELYQNLKQLFGVTDPQVVAKYICRLRRQFRDAVQGPLGAKQAGAWSKALIEHTMLGYRISIPAERLKVDVFDADRLVASSLQTLPCIGGDAAGHRGGSAGHRPGTGVAGRNLATASPQEGVHATLEP